VPRTPGRTLLTREQFRELTRPPVGMPISHAVRGFGSAIQLELGALTTYTRTYRKRGEVIHHERVGRPGMTRSRPRFLALAAAAVALGLATRAFRGVLPDAIGAYAGDVLWAAMVYLLIAAAWSRAPIRRIATGAAVFSIAIELSQLYHAPWIDAVRQTRTGGLVLGFGFLWSDLACYAAGIALAAALDRRLARASSSTALHAVADR
jgi:hypothetical protein